MWVSGLDSAVGARFRGHLRAAAETVSQGVSSGRAAASIGQWQKWIDFCGELGLDPFLEAFEDKVPILQVFLHRVRIGELAAKGNQIKSRSAEDYLRAVAQTFLAMGADDPRLNAALKTDFRLSRMLAAWKKQDPPANRVKPVPVAVIRHIAAVAARLPPGNEKLCAAADIIIIAFFFLLRPGEYTDSKSDTTPFTLGDVQLFLGPRRLDLATASDAELSLARAVSLTFTTQKNGVENEVIKMGLSGDLRVCVVKAVTRRVCHLRSHNAPATTPLARVYTGVGRRTQSVTPALISKTLRDAVAWMGSDLGFLPGVVSARSLRAAGAMALLVGKVDPDIIQILGRWRSDEMFRYLHLSAEPIMKGFAAKMLNADYTIAPSQLVPCH
jgi:hypothetical protein